MTALTLTLVVSLVLIPLLTGLLVKEAEGWLAALPVGLLRLARARVPASRRELLYEQWSAELTAALHDKADRPLTRLWLGVRFRLRRLWTARRVVREVRSARGAGCSSPRARAGTAAPDMTQAQVLARWEAPATATASLKPMPGRHVSRIRVHCCDGTLELRVPVGPPVVPVVPPTIEPDQDDDE